MHIKKAIVLLSGGLDSTTCLAYAKAQGFLCYALSFNYNQRHSAEIEAAKKIAAYFNAEHRVFELDMGQFGGSALTDTTMHVPDYVEGAAQVPTTYVPARNTIFLSVALAWAEALMARDIFIGVSQVDYSGYPDCRPEFIQAFQQLARLATKAGIEGHSTQVHAPLVYLSKAETIALGHSLGVDYTMTVSCYRAGPKGAACGSCDSCVLRKKGFREAGVDDFTLYA